MSDDQEDPRTPGARPEPDETRMFPPIAGEAHPDEGPRSGDAAAAWMSDRTGQLPQTPADGTQAMPAADDETRAAPLHGGPDATSVLPPQGAAPLHGGPDATSVLPPQGAAPLHGGPDATSVLPPQGAAPQSGRDEVWSARAEVRPPGPAQPVAVAPTQWAPAEPEPRGAWWMPILIGIVVLLLLAVLGFGVWLIAQGTDNGDETPTPPVTTAVTRAPTKPTTAPTTAPTTVQPTTARPSPTPPEPQTVTVPPVTGLSSSQARRALDRAGLPYRLVFRPSDTAPAGTVISSDPAEGAEVPADTEVTLVIAAPPTPAPADRTPTPTGDEEQPDD